MQGSSRSRSRDNGQADRNIKPRSSEPILGKDGDGEESDDDSVTGSMLEEDDYMQSGRATAAAAIERRSKPKPLHPDSLFERSDSQFTEPRFTTSFSMTKTSRLSSEAYSLGALGDKTPIAGHFTPSGSQGELNTSDNDASVPSSSRANSASTDSCTYSPISA